MRSAILIDKIYGQKWLRIVLHLLFWLLMFGVKLYLSRISFNVYRTFPWQELILLSLSSTLFFAIFYYLSIYVILPLMVKNYTWLFGLLLLLIAYSTFDTYFEMKIVHSCSDCLIALRQENPSYYAFLNSNLSNITLKKTASLGTVISLLIFLSIPLAIKMTLNAFRGQIRELKLANDNLRLEFNFLKAQLNPHFLFNSMNNIYGLILSGNKEKSAGLVARLSELLRYILYDSDQNTMPIEKEIQLIGDYIELEKVRLNYTQVNFNVKLDNKAHEMAPLLLIPLVENAFKYSSDAPSSFIDVALELWENKLRCTISNSVDSNRLPGTSSGIGLSNFKKRMDLYYPENYSYEASLKDATYSVNLMIQFV